MADEKTCGVTVPDSGDGRGCELERNHLLNHIVSMGEGKWATRVRDWSAPDEPKRCAARAISEDSKSRITTCQCDYPAGHDGSHHGRHSDGGGVSGWEPAPGDGDGTVRLLRDPALLSPAEAHVLRSIVASYSDIGYVDLETKDTEWRRALWNLAKRGLVSAYLPTPAGKEVDGMLRESALDIADRRTHEAIDRQHEDAEAPASAASPDKAGATCEGMPQVSAPSGPLPDMYIGYLKDGRAALVLVMHKESVHRVSIGPLERGSVIEYHADAASIVAAGTGVLMPVECPVKSVANIASAFAAAPAKDGSQVSADANVDILARVDAIRADGGISGAESHVLRDIARNCGEHGRVFGDDKILRLLVEHGFVTAYTPTPLGREVVAQLDNGTLLFY